jgi:hypothetical protein
MNKNQSTPDHASPLAHCTYRRAMQIEASFARIVAEGWMLLVRHYRPTDDMRSITKTG